MEYNEVVLSLGKSAFYETGIPPYSLNKVLAYTKENKKYKSEWEDFVSMCSAIQDIPSGLDFINDDGNEVTLKFYAFNGVPKTFKFLGMDVTEELDAVIKGDFGTVFVSSLSNTVGVEKQLSKLGELNDKQIKKIVDGIKRDDIRIAMENLKFGDMLSIPEKYDRPNTTLDSHDKSDFTFLDNICQAIEKRDSGVLYNSVILNFVSDVVSTVDDSINSDDIVKAVYAGICSTWRLMIHRYLLMSKVLSLYSMFFSLRAKLFGGPQTIQTIQDATESSNYGELGCLEGFEKDESVEGRALSCTMGKEFMGCISKLFITGSGTFTQPMNIYMSTMFDYPNSTDITALDRRTCLAYSTLDGLKYNDEDLELVAQDYDMNDATEREVFLRNVITGYKKKFDNMYSEKGISIDDEIIKNILPTKSSVDILNVGKDITKDTPTDIEVSKISFDKTNLLKACKLIYKITDILNKSFSGNI